MATFDPKAGDVDKRAAMDRAAKHANPVWWQAMLEAGRAVALAKPYFFTDDLEAYRMRWHPNVFTHENRALGPLMRQLCALGYCLPTPDWVETSQKQAHRRPMRVWFSLIYRGPGKHRMPRRKVHDPRQFFFDLDAVALDEFA